MAEPRTRPPRPAQPQADARSRWNLRTLLRHLLLPLAGAALVAGVGWASFTQFGHKDAWGERKAHVSYGELLRQLSYDLPFATIFEAGHILPRLHPPPKDIFLIYMDDEASRALGQPPGIWDRGVHASLVRKLTADGARAVFFDLVFSAPAERPEVDQNFANAIKENGHVFLSASLELDASVEGAAEQVFPPTAALRRAAAAWGLDAFRPVDHDWAVRRLYAGTETTPVASWRMATKFGASLPAEDDVEARAQPRWMNYYGPVGCFSQLRYHQALQDMPAGYFKDKFVFVGGRSSIGTLGLGKDDFAHPFTRWDQRYSPGLEIHATAFLNFLRHEWLTHCDERWEDAFILGFGALLGALLPRFRPMRAALIAMLAAALITLGAHWLVLSQHLWFAWCVPVLLQIPIALVWAISMRYLLEERRSKALRAAFSQYLSPHMADRIAESQFNLEPGGTVVEASIMFTDLEGFTKMSEELKDPVLITEVLTEYFTEATKHVLGNDGTILKFIGDAVLAVWGAPLPDPRHPVRAATAALGMQGAAKLVVNETVVKTRIGLHTGRVLAGNLGSRQRFDYTIIGDPANLASRLEGLNKHLKTHILMSEATHDRLDGAFLTRRVGQFKVEGRSEPVTAYELIGPPSQDGPPDWVSSFAHGLAQYQARDFAGARETMEQVSVLRGENDGPAEFYRKTIDQLKAEKLLPGWNGVIELAK